MTLLHNDFATFAADPVAPLAPIPAMTLAAFSDTAEADAALAELAASRHLGRVTMTRSSGGLAAAITAAMGGAAPHLWLIEVTGPEAQVLTDLDNLSEHCDPDTRVILFGGSNDIAFYRALLERGVSDYLPRPASATQMLRSIANVTSHPGNAPRGLLVACLGAGGGTGSSTVALNLAWLLGRSRHGGASLLDLDLDYGTAGLSLALDNARGIAEALRAGTALDAQLLDGLFDRYDDHLRVLATGENGAPGVAPLSEPAEALEHLTEMARSGGHPVLLDLPCLPSPVTRRALLAADRVVLTATPDLAGLRHTRRLLDQIAALRSDDPHPLVVLNKAGMARRSGISPRDFAQTLGITLAATLSFDPRGFAQSTNLGKVHASTRAGRSAATALVPLLRALGDGDPTAPARPAPRPSLLARLFRRG